MNFRDKKNMEKSKSRSRPFENKELTLQHVQHLHEDIRQEIKQRIQQRDAYSIQMTLALATIVSVTAAATAPVQKANDATSIVSFAYRALIAAPLVSIYYTTLILYSYRVHHLLSRYIKDVIEPELARLSGVSLDIEWESWYNRHALPGIRKSFFLGSLWILCIISPLYIAFSERWQGGFMVPLGIIATIYLVVTIWITKNFWKD
jgi:hypothetical protein